MLDYPYFADLRGDGLNPDNPISASLDQLSMAWASPISIDGDRNAAREVTGLLYSSPESWLSSSLDVMPKVGADGNSIPYQPGGERGRQLLGAIVQGRFESYFAGQDSPLIERGEDQGDAAGADDSVISGVIERSPEAARIILYASNEFLNDRIMELAGASSGSDYLNGAQLMANTVDWSVEDPDLLGIRARGQFNRSLPPLKAEQRVFWEGANYALAVLILLALAAGQHWYRRRKARRYFEQLSV